MSRTDFFLFQKKKKTENDLQAAMDSFAAAEAYLEEVKNMVKEKLQVHNRAAKTQDE